MPFDLYLKWKIMPGEKCPRLKSCTVVFRREARWRCFWRGGERGPGSLLWATLLVRDSSSAGLVHAANRNSRISHWSGFPRWPARLSLKNWVKPMIKAKRKLNKKYLFLSASTKNKHWPAVAVLPTVLAVNLSTAMARLRLFPFLKVGDISDRCVSNLWVILEELLAKLFPWDDSISKNDGLLEAALGNLPYSDAKISTKNFTARKNI